MRFQYVLLSLFIFCSCLHEDSSRDKNSIDIHPQPEKDQFLSNELWICHHPNTKFHDSLCVEKYFPDGCYVKGDNSKFCWKLTSKDCEDLSEDSTWYHHCRSLFE